MTDKSVWFITGAGRGMGVDIAKAALAAGNAVVATGRNTDIVTAAVGQDDELRPSSSTSLSPPTPRGRPSRCRPVRTHRRAHQQRGQLLRGVLRGDRPGDFRSQVEFTLFGPMNVSRAVLPVMRAQRSGLVVAMLLDRRDRGPRVLQRVCGVQVRGGGLDPSR